MLYESWINFYEILFFFMQLIFFNKENIFIYVWSNSRFTSIQSGCMAIVVAM